MNAGTATVTISPDLRGLQMLGDAARAVELAADGRSNLEPHFVAVTRTAYRTWETGFTRGYPDGVDERTALLNLAACCLARLHEIR